MVNKGANEYAATEPIRHSEHFVELVGRAGPDDAQNHTDRESVLVVNYVARAAVNPTFRESRHVSARLPDTEEFRNLFDNAEGRVEVVELTPGEREMVTTASAELGNPIDFEGTKTAEVEL